MPAITYRLCTVPFATLLLCLIFWVTPVHADNYEVKDVQVDVSAGSALTARKQAFVDARKQAFGILADRMLTPQTRPLLVMPSDKALSDMVRDFEIVDERMTSKRYAGRVNIRFNPTAARAALKVFAGTPQAAAAQAAPTAPAVPVAAGDSQSAQPAPQAVSESADAPYVPDAPKRAARTVLVLPWSGPIGQQKLWGSDNAWRAAWDSQSGSGASDGAMTILVPLGDVDDLRDYNPAQPLSRRVNLENLMARYSATEVVLALAEPMPEGSLAVSLYRYQGNNPLPLGRMTVTADAWGDVYGAAVQRVTTVLRQQEPITQAGPSRIATQQQTAAPASGNVTGTYITIAQFSGLAEWVALRAALKNAPGVQQLDMLAISPAQAKLSLVYQGDPAGMQAAFARSGLSFYTRAGADGLPQYHVSLARRS